MSYVRHSVFCVLFIFGTVCIPRSYWLIVLYPNFSYEKPPDWLPPAHVMSTPQRATVTILTLEKQCSLLLVDELRVLCSLGETHASLTSHRVTEQRGAPCTLTHKCRVSPPSHHRLPDRPNIARNHTVSREIRRLSIILSPVNHPHAVRTFRTLT